MSSGYTSFKKKKSNLWTDIEYSLKPALGSVGRKSGCSAGDMQFNPCIRKVPWRKKMAAHSSILPGKSHGQRNLAGYGPKCHKRVKDD